MSNPAKISLASVQADPASYVDPQGFLFHYGDDIYRCIYPQAKQLFVHFSQGKILPELSRFESIVKTQVVDLQLAEYPDSLIVKHEKIWPVSYPSEWCPSMLYDAAQLTIDLAIDLTEHELVLQDAYPWNILFSGSKPVLVDLTSIVPINPQLLWSAHEQFEAFFIRPLILMRQGKGLAARALLNDYINGVDLENFARLVNFSYRLRHPSIDLTRSLNKRLQRSTQMKQRVREFSEKHISTVSISVRERFFRKLSKRLGALQQRKSQDHWINYYAEIDAQVAKQVKLQVVDKALDNLKPASVLDIGCNTGVFSILAARHGARVVALDSSESCVEQLYKTAVKEKLSITPLIADIVNPTPAYGFLSQQYPALLSRAAADMVFFLGIMHHVHIAGRQSFARIAELLHRVAKKYLVFEYIALDDDNIPHLPPGRSINYSAENVKSALEKYFTTIDVLPSDRTTRELWVCQR